MTTFLAIILALILVFLAMFIVHITRRIEAGGNSLHQAAMQKALSRFLEARETLQDVPRGFFTSIRDEDFPNLMRVLKETPRLEGMPSKVLDELVDYFVKGGKRERQLLSVLTDEAAYADLLRLIAQVEQYRQNHRQ